MPPGFIVTSEAYLDAMEQSGARDKLRSLMSSVRAEDSEDLAQTCAAAQDLIEQTPIPVELAREILTAYHELGEGIRVAVRSSGTRPIENLPTQCNVGDPGSPMWQPLPRSSKQRRLRRSRQICTPSDLLVLGHHRHGALTPNSLGHVIGSMLHEAACATVVVSEPAIAEPVPAAALVPELGSVT